MARGEWGGRDHRDRERTDRYATEPPRWTGGAPRLAASASWALVLLGLAVWTIVVVIGYFVAALVLGWLGASGGDLLQAGKDVGSALGVGEEVGTAVDTLQPGGLLGGAVAFLNAILMPAALVLWVLGALIIVLLPRMLGRVAGLFMGHRR